MSKLINLKYYNHVTLQRAQTSWRRLQDVWKRSRRLTTKPDVLPTSCRKRLINDVFKTPDLCRLEDVLFMTFWRRPIYNVLKTSDLRRLEEVWFKTSWRRLVYVVLKTSDLRRLKDVWLKTSCRRLIYDVLKTSDSCRLEDVLLTTSNLGRRGNVRFTVLKTPGLRPLEEVCKMTFV